MIKAVTKILKELGEAKPCPDYHPGCLTCQRYLLVGLLEDLKSDLEFDSEIK